MPSSLFICYIFEIKSDIKKNGHVVQSREADARSYFFFLLPFLSSFVVALLITGIPRAMLEKCVSASIPQYIF